MGRKKEIVHVRYRKLKNGDKSIYFDIIRNGNRTYIYQEERLLPETCEANILHNEKIRQIIDERKKKLVAELILDQGEMADHSLSTDMQLVEWMDKHYKVIAPKVSKSYPVGFNTTRRLIEEYRPGILLRDVDENFIVGLCNFMKEHPLTNDPSKTLSVATIHFYIKIISAHLNAAIRERFIQSNPCTSQLAVLHKEVAHRTNIHAFTMKELMSLIDTPCECEDVKRMFLFACFTGIKKKEIQALQWKHISKRNGRTWVTLYLDRASRSIEIPLNDIAKSCLPHRKRAKGSDLVFQHRTFSFLAKHLYSWKSKAGIASDLYFQTARDTYARLLLSVDTDFYTASYMMGFSFMANMAEYEGMLNSKRRYVVDRLDDAFGNLISQQPLSESKEE